jgi:hypothetical protein
MLLDIRQTKLQDPGASSLTSDFVIKSEVVTWNVITVTRSYIVHNTELSAANKSVYPSTYTIRVKQLKKMDGWNM